MIDLKQYSWLNPHHPMPDAGDEERQFIDILKVIEKKESNPALRNIYANYYLEQVEKAKEDGLEWKLDKNLGKEVRSWAKSQSFKKMKENLLKEDKAKFQLSGIVIVVTGTLILFFLRAILAQEFVVNFSVDAIVGAIALVFFYRNMRIKVRLLKSYEQLKDYIYMDVASFVMCILLKMWLPVMFDVSLVILVISYYVQRRKFEKYLKGF